MNRRRWLAGSLALSGLEALAAQEMPESGSLYIPKPHLVEDLRLIQSFVDEFSFASLITAAPSIRVTHIPALLDRGAGRYGRILGHVARNNPQKAALEGKHEGVIVFRGPHHYISPAWYQTGPAVPTWNFAVVHATGRPRLIEDQEQVLGFLERLIAKYEARENSSWNLSKVPEGYRNGLIKGAVMFEMPVERFEAKFKLSLERTDPDRQGLLRGLKSASRERDLAALTEQRLTPIP